MSGVRVEGLRETVRSLERFGVEVKDLKAAFVRIGNIIVGDARSLTPKKTGRLAASIKPSNTKNKSIVRAGGGSILYAGVQHYGGYNHIQGSFYLTKAVDKNQSRAVAELDRELNTLIRKTGLI